MRCDGKASRPAHGPGGWLCPVGKEARVLNFRFRPRATDPNGTSAVIVTVRDTVIDDDITLDPACDWQAGR